MKYLFFPILNYLRNCHPRTFAFKNVQPSLLKACWVSEMWTIFRHVVCVLRKFWKTKTQYGNTKLLTLRERGGIRFKAWSTKLINKSIDEKMGRKGTLFKSLLIIASTNICRPVTLIITTTDRHR